MRAVLRAARTTLLAATTGLALVACGRGETPASPETRRVELVVGVTASLRQPLDEAIAEFRRHFPRIGIVTTAASSGVLAEQVRAGAPVDIVLLADPRRMAGLAAEGLVEPDGVRPLAGNSLVAVVPASSEVFLRQPSELVDPRLQRIAVANPELAPVGAHARTALEQHGAWEAIAERTVLTENAGHTIDLAVRGEVDLAFVYATDAMAAGDAVRVVLTFPIEGTIYEAALLRRSQSADRFPASSRAFFEFLTGEDFRPILEQRGFRLE